MDDSVNDALVFWKRSAALPRVNTSHEIEQLNKLQRDYFDSDMKREHKRRQTMHDKLPLVMHNNTPINIHKTPFRSMSARSPRKKKPELQYKKRHQKLVQPIVDNDIAFTYIDTNRFRQSRGSEGYLRATQSAGTWRSSSISSHKEHEHDTMDFWHAYAPSTKYLSSTFHCPISVNYQTPKKIGFTQQRPNVSSITLPLEGGNVKQKLRHPDSNFSNRNRAASALSPNRSTWIDQIRLQATRIVASFLEHSYLPSAVAAIMPRRSRLPESRMIDFHVSRQEAERIADCFKDISSAKVEIVSIDDQPEFDVVLHTCKDQSTFEWINSISECEASNMIALRQLLPRSVIWGVYRAQAAEISECITDMGSISSILHLHDYYKLDQIQPQRRIRYFSVHVKDVTHFDTRLLDIIFSILRQKGLPSFIIRGDLDSFSIPERLSHVSRMRRSSSDFSAIEDNSVPSTDISTTIELDQSGAESQIATPTNVCENSSAITEAVNDAQSSSENGIATTMSQKELLDMYSMLSSSVTDLFDSKDDFSVSTKDLNMLVDAAGGQLQHTVEDVQVLKTSELKYSSMAALIEALAAKHLHCPNNKSQEALKASSPELLSRDLNVVESANKPNDQCSIADSVNFSDSKTSIVPYLSTILDLSEQDQKHEQALHDDLAKLSLRHQAELDKEKETYESEIKRLKEKLAEFEARKTHNREDSLQSEVRDIESTAEKQIEQLKDQQLLAMKSRFDDQEAELMRLNKKLEDALRSSISNQQDNTEEKIKFAREQLEIAKLDQQRQIDTLSRQHAEELERLREELHTKLEHERDRFAAAAAQAEANAAAHAKAQAELDALIATEAAALEERRLMQEAEFALKAAELENIRHQLELEKQMIETNMTSYHDIERHNSTVEEQHNQISLERNELNRTKAQWQDEIAERERQLNERIREFEHKQHEMEVRKQADVQNNVSAYIHSRRQSMSELHKPRSASISSLSSIHDTITPNKQLSRQMSKADLKIAAADEKLDKLEQLKKTKFTTSIEDLAAMEPEERAEKELELLSYAQHDELFCHYLGVSAKELEKGPADFYVLMKLRLVNAINPNKLIAPALILEVYSCREDQKVHGKVFETERYRETTSSLRPIILSVNKLCLLQLEREVCFRVTNHVKLDEPRQFVGEVFSSLSKLQSMIGKSLPLIDSKKPNSMAGQLLIEQVEFYVDGTFGVSNFPSPSVADIDPQMQTSTLLSIKFTGSNLEAKGIFGSSRSQAYIALYRLERSGTFADSPTAQTEVQIGDSVQWSELTFRLYDLCFEDCNRAILFRLYNASSIGGSSSLKCEKELTVFDMLSDNSDLFFYHNSKKPDAGIGRIMISECRAYTALADLQRLCDAAGLKPATKKIRGKLLPKQNYGIYEVLVKQEKRLGRHLPEDFASDEVHSDDDNSTSFHINDEAGNVMHHNLIEQCIPEE